MRGGGNSELDREQDILKQVQDDINFPKNEPIHLLLHKFFAFTLAEVLITLGIIGIVAALTMPSLISNHKKKVYVTQLKKAVNTTTNGLKMILADSEVDTLSNTPFYSQLSQALTSKNMSDLNNTARKYFNLGKDVSFVARQTRNYSVVNGERLSHSSSGGNQPYSDTILFSTVDGAEILIGLAWPVFLVSVDVNGYNKFPNTQGLDYFSFFIKEDGSVNTYGSDTVDYCLSNSFPSDYYHTSWGCYSSVVANNWEITY